MCAQRTLKHVRATNTKACARNENQNIQTRPDKSKHIPGAFHRRLKSGVSASESMRIAFFRARATKDPLPIDRVTKYIDHGNLDAKVFGLMDRCHTS